MTKTEPIPIISKCDQLSMDVFIDCLVTGNYAALGGGSLEDLHAAWNEVMTEYAELIGSEHYIKAVRLTKEINFNRLKFVLIEAMVQVLQVQYTDVLVKELKRLGFPGQYNWDIQERYQKELKAAYSKAKVYLVTAQTKQKELQEMEAKIESGKMDRKYFDSMFISLSQYFKYQVKEHEITVQKYCLMVKGMNDYYESLTRKN